METLKKLIQELDIKSNAEDEILVKIKSSYQELVVLLPLEDSIEKKLILALKNLDQKDSDIFKFNEDGTYFYTLKSTIARKFQKENETEFYKPNLLEEMYTESIQNNNEIPLINRSPIYFQYILNYLRCPEDLNEIISHIFRLGYCYKSLRTEAEYFKVYSLFEKLQTSLIEINYSSNLDSSILSQREFLNLLVLCNFDLNCRWQQLYRATRDGFSAANFHSKCDGQSNTLSVIRTNLGFVFGGFTTKPWSGKVVYENDPEAFIFSLINSKNTPMKFDCKTPKHAIRCNSDRGPTFGGGHDIYICNNSNTVQSSYSNFYSSYKNDQLNLTNGTEEANLFLAGSYQFLTTEIEVFQKI